MKFGIRIRFIATARSFWRFWSLRLTALGTALLAFLISSPDTILYAWNALPADLKGVIPVDYTLYISLALLVLGMFSRVVKQEKIPEPKPEKEGL